MAGLPRGLVGSKCTAVVTIAGKDCSCLLDSGSQVTTVPVSFYNQYLSDQPLNSLDNLLQVEGAAGQPVPYLGYVEVTAKFHEDFLGSEFEVLTLALVVPDTHTSNQSSILIGMNTLEVLYEQFLNSHSIFQPQSNGYRAVLKMLELHHQKTEAGNIGVVHSPSKTPLLIPAHQTVVLEGSARVSCPSSGSWAIVEHPQSSLPAGLFVKTSLITLPSQSPYKVPVVLTNQTEQDVFIPPLTVIAELETCQAIISQQCVKAAAPRESKVELNFNFGESNLPPEWKERITN